MSENVKKAMEFISNNEDLKKRLDALREEYSSLEEINLAIIEIMKEYGFELTMEELMPKTEVSADMSEISDDELEAVAGGKIAFNNSTKAYYCDCFCTIGGSGSKDEYQKQCVCVLGGGGELNAAGRKRFDNTFGLCCVFAGTSYYLKEKDVEI